jgi:hypothetical protein
MRKDDGWGGGLDEQAKKLIYIYIKETNTRTTEDW